MYSSTAAGTSPWTGDLAAMRRRTPVDDTGAVGASTNKIPGLAGKDAMPDGSARIIRDASDGSMSSKLKALGQVRARDDRHVTPVEDGGVVLPARDVLERVGARDEAARARVDARRRQPIQRHRRRMTASARAHLEIRHEERGRGRNGERDHREPMGRRGFGSLAMRRDVGRDEVHVRQAQHALRGLGHVEVSPMNRIERPAVVTDAHQATAGAIPRATSRHMASRRAGTPAPVTADTGKTCTPIASTC